MKAPIVRCLYCDSKIKYCGMGGKAVMVDADPRADGTVRLNEEGDEKPTGQSLAGEALALATGKLHRLHKCPKNSRGLL